jgi:hypothetical protein
MTDEAIKVIKELLEEANKKYSALQKIAVEATNAMRAAAARSTLVQTDITQQMDLILSYEKILKAEKVDLPAKKAAKSTINALTSKQ